MVNVYTKIAGIEFRNPVMNAAGPPGRSCVAIPPFLDEKLRKGCKICEQVCNYHAIDLLGEEKTLRVVNDNDICYGCGLCVSICPTRALAFKEDTR